MEEYEVAGAGRVRVEFVDPLQAPALEEEANRRYNIQPVPFQTTSKYQASVTNSYFDIVVQYGDEFETLGYGDLIEIKAGRSEEHTSELQSLMRISYAVFCLTKKRNKKVKTTYKPSI